LTALLARQRLKKALQSLSRLKFVAVNFANSTLQIDTPDIEEVKQK